jgi:uncharacterized membrane protein
VVSNHINTKENEMDKMVVLVFNDERKAYEGAQALKGLHAEGSLTLYQSTVISKDAKGAVSVKESADQGPVGTAVGWATGGLIGLLGGPVGWAVGAATGTLAGSFYDLAQLGVGSDFIDEVSQYLLSGKTAVVAEVEEGWVTPLDTRVEALGGKVFRRGRGEFIDAQWQKDIDTTKAEIKELKDEFNQETGEAKAKIKTKIEAAKQRLQAKQDQIKETIQNNNREFEAKLNSLQEQVTKAKDEKKAALQKRIGELKADQEARAKKLNEAWEATKEAIAI